MGLGNWNVNVNVSGMPQCVATAFSALADSLLGAEYEFIAYLGSQLVNGTNHAVLAKQIVIDGRDTENVVVLIFHETKGNPQASLVNIERVVEGGLPLGGTKVEVVTGPLPEDAQGVWDEAFMTFVGSKVEPFAFLGTQIVNGMNYIYAATITPVVPEAAAKVVVVTINSNSRTVDFADLFDTKQAASLGYAFTWLKHT